LGGPLQIDIKDQSNAAAKRVGVILRRLGWTSYVARAGGSTVKRWRMLPVLPSVTVDVTGVSA
jgi:hypothetical protein